MSMQVIPTFKKMDLSAPMANQQMIFKRNNDFITNLLQQYQLNKTTDSSAFEFSDDTVKENFDVIKDLIGEMYQRKNNATGIGWTNRMDQTPTKKP